jgi:hypothetical protein
MTKRKMIMPKGYSHAKVSYVGNGKVYMKDETVWSLKDDGTMTKTEHDPKLTAGVDKSLTEVDEKLAAEASGNVEGKREGATPVETPKGDEVVEAAKADTVGAGSTDPRMQPQGDDMTAEGGASVRPNPNDTLTADKLFGENGAPQMALRNEDGGVNAAAVADLPDETKQKLDMLNDDLMNRIRDIKERDLEIARLKGLLADREAAHAAATQGRHEGRKRGEHETSLTTVGTSIAGKYPNDVANMPTVDELNAANGHPTQTP